MRPPNRGSSDPLLPAPGSPQVSVPFDTPPPGRLERGVVLSVDARRHSYRVALNSGRQLTVARILPTPGDSGILPAGTDVAVTFDLGTPYILGVLPPGGAHEDGTTSLTDTDGNGGDDPALDQHHSSNGRDANTPRDMLPGDRAITSPDGASVAALAGKVALLSGGPLAKVSAHGDTDHVNIRAGSLRTETWMGFSETVNEGGKTSYRFRGGTDQLTQTGQGEERYTIHLDAGHTGDVLRLELTNREGQALFRFHVDPAGHVELFAAGGFAQTHGDRADAPHERAHHGNSAERVTGDVTHTVNGSRTDSIGEFYRAEVGDNFDLVAGGGVNLVGTNSAAIQSAGPAGIVSAQRVTVAGQGVTLKPGLETLLVDTALPDRIKFGTNASSHGVKYEELVPILTFLLRGLNELRSAFATHAHPGAPQNPAYLQYGVPLTVDLAGCRSLVFQLM